ITLAQVVRTQALLRARLVEFRLDGDIDSVLAAFVPGRHAALDEVVANVQTARAEYRGALTQLRRSRAESLDTLRLAAVVADHASRLAAGRIAHGQLNLRSPASGIVLTNEPERLVGEFVQPGQAVLEIASIEGWRAVLVLTAAQVALIRPSDAVVLEVPGLSGPVESRLTGRVSSISPQLEAKSDSRGYAVHVAIDGGWRPLGAAVAVRPGFAVKASIITRSATGLELLQSWLSRSVRRVRVSASDPLSR
ncbi:MAG: efflux RND transporter periplasmic adaptor subunit, partial [Cryobacterium sp.]|nr:efflux RND transporter periplasmic adaptor subunit [Cryobacterium sp.]